MESSMEDRAYMDSLFVAGEVPKVVQHSVRLQTYFNKLDKIIECAQFLFEKPSKLSPTRHGPPKRPHPHCMAHSAAMLCRQSWYRGTKKGRPSASVCALPQVCQPR